MGRTTLTVVTLEPWEYEWAAHVGTQRDEINRTKNNAAYYDTKRMEDNRHANIMSCCGELAVAKYLNRYWGGDYWPLDRHKEFKDLPDIRPNIEVRRIRKRDNPLAVRKRDAERERAMFLTYPDPNAPTEVTIIGWVDARKAWRYGKQPGWDQTGTARVYPQEKLHDPSTYTDKEPVE
jgi:hypothetical protein